MTHRRTLRSSLASGGTSPPGVERVVCRKLGLPSSSPPSCPFGTKWIRLLGFSCDRNPAVWEPRRLFLEQECRAPALGTRTSESLFQRRTYTSAERIALAFSARLGLTLPLSSDQAPFLCLCPSHFPFLPYSSCCGSPFSQALPAGTGSLCCSPQAEGWLRAGQDRRYGFLLVSLQLPHSQGRVGVGQEQRASGSTHVTPNVPSCCQL